MLMFYVFRQGEWGNSAGHLPQKSQPEIMVFYTAGHDEKGGPAVNKPRIVLL
ncbi:hypothetical protein [Grimontia hollisae]|uniref:Uncharacterized protein n=1 Tax=Grimontia hollisae CIP 101886 TaxID=675812 RepID=D0I7H5_GRIHO|nr:hypothetical protein [Grimontia hollisae]EEY72594.1 hypothetical protein VHA_001699 [Grimontia hollisae CIP 101886]MDF2185410.1 hypothetical protein [Grimontia hollisae]